MYQYIQYVKNANLDTSARVIALLSSKDYLVDVEGAEVIDCGETASAAPLPEMIPGMSSGLRVNLDTKELYYEYTAVETLESQILTLKTDSNELRRALMELTMALAGTE